VVKDWLCHSRPFEYEYEYEYRFTEYEYEEIRPEARTYSDHPVAGADVSTPETADPLLECIGVFVAFWFGVRGANLTTLRPDIACRRRSSAPIRETSFPCSAASWWRIVRISSVIGLGVICIS
jgi:hypothetical protein